MRYATARLDELEHLPAFGEREIWRPVRHHFGIEAFGINAYTAGHAGMQVIEEHDEVGTGGGGRHQELYVVITGRASFAVDGEEIDAPAVTFVFIGEPEVRRGAVAAEPGTTVLAIGGRPGQAFTTSPWEWSFRALAKPYDEALAIFEDGIARFPDNAGIRYNLACRQAQEGKSAEAIAALRKAIELNPAAREWAAGDDDLASLRDEPEFEALVRAT
jgi:tetratricopeptide (TPR) repeat protein